jgi:hypothetical protein
MMPYPYCVVWFTNSKFWVEERKNPRKRPPLVVHVRVFRSLKRAMEFRKEWGRKRDTAVYENLYWL